MVYLLATRGQSKDILASSETKQILWLVNALLHLNEKSAVALLSLTSQTSGKEQA